MNMKYGWLLALVMVPYGALVPQSPGNPNDASYAGQPGSVYDSAANPAKTNGVVSYNPMAPLPPTVAPTPVPPPAAAPAR
jgi:hypothetical protein